MKKLTVFAGLMLVSATAGAVVFGGSNLGLFGYPEAKCYKPTRPYDLSDEYAVNRYNSDLREYKRCLTEYVENANNDMKRIREAVEEALEQ